MASLVFGVLEVAYSDAHNPNNPKAGATTTGEVAEILERQYGVMQTFYDLRKGRIAEYLADGMASALQDLVSGRSTIRSAMRFGTGSAMYGAAQRIEHEFRAFLDANEMNKISVALAGSGILNPNISAAAAAGVNHRKKHPYAKKNRARPAFIDTGLYRSSFRALVRL